MEAINVSEELSRDDVSTDLSQPSGQSVVVGMVGCFEHLKRARSSGYIRLPPAENFIINAFHEFLTIRYAFP